MTFAPTTWYIGNPAIRPDRAYMTCRLACVGTPLHTPTTSTRDGRLGMVVVLCVAWELCVVDVDVVGWGVVELSVAFPSGMNVVWVFSGVEVNKSYW